MTKDEQEILELQIAIRDESTRIIGSKIGRVFEVKPNV